MGLQVLNNLFVLYSSFCGIVALFRLVVNVWLCWVGCVDFIFQHRQHKFQHDKVPVLEDLALETQKECAALLGMKERSLYFD